MSSSFLARGPPAALHVCMYVCMYCPYVQYVCKLVCMYHFDDDVCMHVCITMMMILIVMKIPNYVYINTYPLENYD